MKQNDYRLQSLGDIVTDDFRMASVFKEKGIDFCCGGKKTLLLACDEKKIDVTKVMAEMLEIARKSSSSSPNFKEWDLDFLADYIMNTHHKFVLKALPDLLFYTDKIATVHGSTHPELILVADLILKINVELLQHLRNEEEVLFPAIKKVLKNNLLKDEKIIIASEIERMSSEHEFAGGAMDQINELTLNYAIPVDACNTYKVALKLLEEFEDDLHVHVHLENNILYPKALMFS